MKKSIFENFKRYIGFLPVGIFLMVIGVYQLLGIRSSYREQEEAYLQLESKAVMQKEVVIDVQETQKVSEELFDYQSVVIDFEELKNTNEDIVGWILFDHNGISYPILQGKDNEEYLYRLPDKTQGKAGSIFLDALCAKSFTDLHTIVYGHNMKDFSMFGKLKNFQLQEDYYKENSCFTVYTEKQNFRYEIFAWYEVDAEDLVYRVGFSRDDVFEEFVNQMLRRRYVDTKITAGREDTIMTLSTCSAKDRRFVVHGKLIASWY